MNYLVIRIEMSFVLCFPVKILRSRSVSYISLTLIQTIPKRSDGLAELYNGDTDRVSENRRSRIPFTYKA